MYLQILTFSTYIILHTYVARTVVLGTRPKFIASTILPDFTTQITKTFDRRTCIGSPSPLGLGRISGYPAISGRVSRIIRQDIRHPARKTKSGPTLVCSLFQTKFLQYKPINIQIYIRFNFDMV